jgi:1-acyl-sn-glycerol-3-phosphate acyltransferase
VLLVRSLAFNVCFYLNTIIHLLVYLPVLLLPRRTIWTVIRTWSMINHRLLLALCGIDFEIRGIERIPSGPLLVAAKHQSAWETFTLPTLFNDPTFILKRELMWLPIFGWYLAKSRMVPIRRGARKAALAGMAERAKVEISASRQIIIFPEGTRRLPGAEPGYKYGVAHLYAELGVPCLPIALNSGLYWPRRTWRLRPGTIRVEILEPIPPGLDPQAFLARLQNEIETATARLLAEGRAEAGRRNST